MNWEAIGALAEVAGAIGVILSLVYLGFQIRLNSKQISENSNFIESSIYQSVNDSVLGWHALIAKDRDVANIWKKIRAGLDIEEEERAQAWGLVSMVFITIEGQHKHFESGVISRAPLDQQGVKQLLESPYVAHWLNKNACSMLLPTFVEELNKIKENEAYNLTNG